MEEILPPGAVEATAKLLVASGAAGEAAVRFSRSRIACSIYEACDWMMPGQFEAFAYRKAFCERQVREGIGAGVNQVLVLGAGSRIAFTYIGTSDDGRPDAGRWTGLVLWILEVSGEPWHWTIRPEELAHFVEETGWTNAPDLVGTTSRRGVEYFGVATKRVER